MRRDSFENEEEEEELLSYHLNTRQSDEPNDRSIITHWLISLSRFSSSRLIRLGKFLFRQSEENEGEEFHSLVERKRRFRQRVLNSEQRNPSFDLGNGVCFLWTCVSSCLLARSLNN